MFKKASELLATQKENLLKQVAAEQERKEKRVANEINSLKKFITKEIEIAESHPEKRSFDFDYTGYWIQSVESVVKDLFASGYKVSHLSHNVLEVQWGDKPEEQKFPPVSSKSEQHQFKLGNLHIWSWT